MIGMEVIRGALFGRGLGLGLLFAGALLRRGGHRHAVAVGARLGDLLLLLADAGRLADTVAQIEELRPADAAGALDFDLGDLWRVHREDALDAFALHDAA